MDLRFFHPELRAGPLPLCLGALTFLLLQAQLKGTVWLEAAVSFVAVGLLVGTFRQFHRTGLAVSAAMGAAESARILSATGASLLAEDSLVDCQRPAVGVGRLFGLAVFVAVYALVGRLIGPRLNDPDQLKAEVPWFRKFTANPPTQLISALWGAIGAYTLVFFLVGTVIGASFVDETPLYSGLWSRLQAGSAEVGKKPLLGDDLAEALKRIIPGREQGFPFCPGGQP